MASYKLVYFQGRGRAEAVRLAFAYGGIEFVDARLPGAELMAKKASGEIKPPFGQFPFLEITDKGVTSTVAQSGTMLRFVGKLAGLIPADAVTAAQAESVVDQMNDVAGACYGDYARNACAWEERGAIAFRFLLRLMIPIIF